MSMKDITRIAAEARKHNMTYGQYMSQKPFKPVEKKADAVDLDPPRRCVVCGAILTGKKQKYCCHEHNVQHQKALSRGDFYV